MSTHPALHRCFITYMFPYGADLPPFKGSTLRGAFGKTLRQTLCRIPRNNCSSCAHLEECQYVHLFEPRVPEHLRELKLGNRAPLPFIFKLALRSPIRFSPQEIFTFELVLLTTAVEQVPLLIFCFELMGLEGLGVERHPALLLEVAMDRGDGSVVPLYRRGDDRIRLRRSGVRPLPLDFSERCDRFAGLSSLRLRLLTPLRVQTRGLLQDRLDFPTLIVTLLRRIAFLSYIYEQSPPSFESEELIEMARLVEVVGDNLTWQQLERYSNRQHGKIDLSGLLGEIEFSGPIGPFLPWLCLGEFLHLGKSCSFGLGEYHIADPDELCTTHLSSYRYAGPLPSLPSWSPRQERAYLREWAEEASVSPGRTLHPLFVLLNHRLTDEQFDDARHTLGIDGLLAPQGALAGLWAELPPAGELPLERLALLTAWLDEVAEPGDPVLVQGESGATFYMVTYCLYRGLVPLYATTDRQVEEVRLPDGRVETRRIFRHVGFRRYEAFWPSPEAFETEE